ncbi:hypothetical protein I3760_01G086900 [Carya illinoinensis]|nr:hypothetical protein I3760_01G086900 [Carya illinoinensis]
MTNTGQMPLGRNHNRRCSGPWVAQCMRSSTPFLGHQLLLIHSTTRQRNHPQIVTTSVHLMRRCDIGAPHWAIDMDCPLTLLTWISPWDSRYHHPLRRGEANVDDKGRGPPCRWMQTSLTASMSGPILQY